jgi:GH24 family phage-related lysozyme (muramidase)
MQMTSTALPAPITQRLRRIQQALGVTADGVLGPETLTALETRLSVKSLARNYNLEVSCESLNALAQFEITSKSAYEQKYRRPIWPGASSGVTIGIGYDLGMTNKSQIELDWQGWISDTDLQRLLTVQGIRGETAKQLARSLSDVQIAYDVAQTIFYQSTLPTFAAMTRATFPGVQKLPADAQGMLLSLIYNRGTSLSGTRRSEMASLKPLIAGGTRNLEEIASKIEQMSRLWPDLPGLQQRRRKEAAIIRAANKEYRAGDLVRL